MDEQTQKEFQLNSAVELARGLVAMYGKSGEHLKNLHSITGTKQLIGRIQEFVVEVNEYYNVILESWKHSTLIGHYVDDIKQTLENIQKCFQGIQQKSMIVLVKSKLKSKVNLLHQTLQANCAKLLASVTSQKAPQSNDLVSASMEILAGQAAERELRDAHDWYYGITRPKNLSIAFGKYSELSKARNKDAMYMLSECYRLAHGTERNEELSRVWLKRAIDLGNVTARMKFARNLLESEQISEENITDFISKMQEEHSVSDLPSVKDSLADYNFSDIYEWMQAANEEDSSSPNFEVELLLGLIFEKAGDFVNALQWFESASSHGCAEATFRMGLIYSRGDSVIPQAEVAFECFMSAARSGVVEAFFHVGFCFEQGIGVDRSLIEALDFYYRAAGHAHAEAMHNMGFVLLNRARRFSEEQSDNYTGNAKLSPSSQNTAKGLWIHLVNRKIVKSDFLQSNIQTDEFSGDLEYIDAIARLGIHYLKRAVDNGRFEASFLLGQVYESGFSVVPVDAVSSFQHYLSAANHGHGDAALCIANMYYRGIGTKVDLHKARHYYKIAAATGKNSDAMNSLGILLEDSASEKTVTVDDVQKIILEAASWFYEAISAHDHIQAGENLISLLVRNTWIEKICDIQGGIHSTEEVTQLLATKVPDAQLLAERTRQEVEESMFLPVNETSQLLYRQDNDSTLLDQSVLGSASGVRVSHGLNLLRGDGRASRDAGDASILGSVFQNMSYRNASESFIGNF